MIANSSIRGFIEEIQQRPSMYIGGRTIHHLKSFIDGWLFGASDKIEDVDIIEDFYHWLVIKYEIKGTQSWSQIILFYSMDEYSALVNFFQLFSEFVECSEGTASSLSVK